MSCGEKRLISALFLIAAAVFCALLVYNFFQNTKSVPVAGGEYREGVVGSLNFVNPVLSSFDDANQVLNNLVFNGILKSDGLGGLQPDLAERYEILENGRIWKVYLRKDVFWHDGEKFTADDVIFTVLSILNPEVRSPLYLSWQGVKAEKIDDYAALFTLRSPYAVFDRNLANLKILPKHIWEKTPPGNFHLSEYNWTPVGTGPYCYEKLEKSKDGKIASFALKSNGKYFLGKPYIYKIFIGFYADQEEAIRDYERGKLDGIANVSAKNLDGLRSKYRVFEIYLPRSYAVFFNPNRDIFSKKNVRQALELAIDKNILVKEIFKDRAAVLTTPFSKGMLGYDENSPQYDFSIAQAKALLEQEGYRDEDADGNLDGMEFTLRFPETAFLMETASLLKNQWSKIGVKVNLESVNIDIFKENYLKSRDYEAILFGQILNYDPDLFSFWHSSERIDPGLNIALYENKEVDRLIEESRQTIDIGSRKEKLEKIQKIFIEDKPAIFLYNPYYLYLVSPDIKGIAVSSLDLPYQRFYNVSDWYIKTKRAEK